MKKPNIQKLGLVFLGLVLGLGGCAGSDQEGYVLGGLIFFLIGLLLLAAINALRDKYQEQPEDKLLREINSRPPDDTGSPEWKHLSKTTFNEGKQYFVRFLDDGSPRWGQVFGHEVQRLRNAPWVSLEAYGPPLKMPELALLAPVEPKRIVGVNYHDAGGKIEAFFLRKPNFYSKPVSAVLDPQGIIRSPGWKFSMKCGVSLAMVIGRDVPQGRDRDRDDIIFGFTCANDISAWDPVAKEGRLDQAKGYATFCPLGPVLAAGLDASNLGMFCRVDGQVRQNTTTADLHWNPQALLRFLRQETPLEPGDVVLMGTPVDQVILTAGDTVEVEIEGIGILVNTCESVP